MRISTVYLLVTASAFFWGANFVLAGPILADLPPLWAAAVRFVLGAALMFAIAGVRRENLLGLVQQHAPIYLAAGRNRHHRLQPVLFLCAADHLGQQRRAHHGDQPLAHGIAGSRIPGRTHHESPPRGVAARIDRRLRSSSRRAIWTSWSLCPFARGDLLMLGGQPVVGDV